ncbi:hypothetical protein Tco_0921614 [Tanacetum coccineum]
MENTNDVFQVSSVPVSGNDHIIYKEKVGNIDSRVININATNQKPYPLLREDINKPSMNQDEKKRNMESPCLSLNDREFRLRAIPLTRIEALEDERHALIQEHHLYLNPSLSRM